MLAISGSVQCSELLWFRVGTKDDCLFRYLSDFQNCLLFEGFNLLKYSALAQRMSDTTLFLASLNLAKWSGLPDFLALLNIVFCRRIDLTRFLFNQGKLRQRGGSTLLGMLSSIIDRKVLCHFAQQESSVCLLLFLLCYSYINFSFLKCPLSLDWSSWLILVEVVLGSCWSKCWACGRIFHVNRKLHVLPKEHKIGRLLCRGLSRCSVPHQHCVDSYIGRHSV